MDTLIKDRGGSYQVCGPTAFLRYGFVEQVPNRVYDFIGILAVGYFPSRRTRKSVNLIQCSASVGPW